MTRASTPDEIADYYRDDRKHDFPVRLLPPGDCAYCDANRGDPMMPSHSPSSRCESGGRPHCTCDVCF